MQGQVLEKSTTSCQYLSNHNGARGFSGTGLFFGSQIVALYSGWSAFDHLGDDHKDMSEDFNALESWEKSVMTSCKGNLNSNCLMALKGFMTTLTRNSRSRIFDISCIFSEPTYNLSNVTLCAI